MTEDAVTIKSLKIQLQEADSHEDEIRCQVVDDYLTSREFEFEKMQIFKDKSMSYQDKCHDASLDLSIIATHIGCGYSLHSSS